MNWKGKENRAAKLVLSLRNKQYKKQELALFHAFEIYYQIDDIKFELYRNDLRNKDLKIK